jgi:hypothetical protein
MFFNICVIYYGDYVAHFTLAHDPLTQTTPPPNPFSFQQLLAMSILVASAWYVAWALRCGHLRPRHLGRDLHHLLAAAAWARRGAAPLAHAQVLEELADWVATPTGTPAASGRGLPGTLGWCPSPCSGRSPAAEVSTAHLCQLLIELDGGQVVMCVLDLQGSLRVGNDLESGEGDIPAALRRMLLNLSQFADLKH